MDIGFVGIGLIGGSLLKAIKKYTNNNCFFLDKNIDAIKKAKVLGLGEELNDESMLSKCDIVFVSLHPQKTIDFINSNTKNFKKGAIVCDVCGIKKEIANQIQANLIKENVHYIGTHPMAGREFSGFDYSTEKLFENAYFIITKNENTNDDALEKIQTLAESLRFKKCVISTEDEHDKIIAFTSQLAHIVSSAYIKSPSALMEKGFSAGSFQDMTRVAYLNEDMWTELFMMNKQNLVYEIETIVNHLNEYKNALISGDDKNLHTLLKEGRELKEAVTKM
ncbi:MAG: prephenate dehydrogenase [Ruminococcaceae bacterium]|nr:prephenate dehydrogenase [Oscillospiraceae bacterium]